MSLTNLSKVTTSGIATGTSLLITNVSSSGVVTASSFSGPLSGDATGLSGTPNITVGVVTASSVTISGDLTVQGSYSTLDTIVTEVDKLEVAANNSTVGVAITQSGTGDILNLFDGASEVFTVLNGGNVGIGLTNPTSKVHVYGNGAEVFVKQDSTIPGSAGFKVFAAGVDSPNNASYYTMNAGSIWGQTGGNGIYFGPENRSSVQFHVKTSTGNIGINTLSPSEKLDVVGNIVSKEQNPYIKIQAGTNGSPYLRFEQDATRRAFLRYQNIGQFDIVNEYGDVTFWTGTSGSETQKMTVTSSGNVGIGTTNPSKNLTITGNNPGILLQEDSTNSELLLTINDSDGTGVIAATRPSNFTYEQLAIRGQDLIFETTSTQSRVERLRITSTGNVGIGTNNPTQKLKVYAGSIEVSRFNGEYTGDAVDGQTSLFTHPGSDAGAGSGSAISIVGGTGSATALYFGDTADADVGSISYFHSDNSLRFTTNTEERLRITSSGNVGIGTENPDKKLRVEGDARITGTLTMGTASISIDGTVEYPSIRPSLDLNFAATKVLDDVITFTRDSIGTYTDELGIIRTAPNNTPRFDHDPETGESLGLLIEESRTNRFVNSIPGTVWSKTNVGSVTTNTTTANYATAPDGTTTATRWQWNIGSTGSDRAILRQGTGSLGSSTLVTLSIYLKSNTGSNQSIALHADGSASSSTSVTVTTEWKRFRFTYTSAIGINNGVEAKGGLTASSGDILVWGAQMEIGGFPTSYIPTSGSTVTRAADFATINGTNFTEIFNTLEGTFFAECDRGNDGTEGAGIGAIRASADSYQNMIQFGEFYDNSGYVGRVYVSGSATALIGATHTTGQGVYNKYALAYKENDFAGTINSVIQSTDNSGALPTGLDRFLFGGYNDDRTNNNLDGHIKRLSYYPKRLPNAQLQGLTAQ